MTPDLDTTLDASERPDPLPWQDGDDVDAEREASELAEEIAQ